MTVKYHLGKNGPAPCNAKKRRCRYDDDIHGEQGVVQREWEKRQAKQFGAVATITKKEKDIATFDDRLKKVVIQIQIESDSNLVDQVENEDFDFYPDGCTDVERHFFTDGSVGYFKKRYPPDEEKLVYRSYGFTSRETMINEVNAYRLSQAMGSGFDQLIPETVICAIGGWEGSLQRGRENLDFSEETKYEIHSNHDWVRHLLNYESVFSEDARKAAIFDFVIGSLDRHEENFLVSRNDDHEYCLTLIDNSFSFPKQKVERRLNETFFVENVKIFWGDDDSKFREDERLALDKAEQTVHEWLQKEQILSEQAQGVFERIDYLRELGRIPDADDINEV